MTIQLSQPDIVRLRRIERVGREVERKSNLAFQKYLAELTERMVMAATENRPMPQVDFEDILLRNAFDAMHAGISEASLNTRPQAKLAAKPPPRVRVPSTLAELQTWWDATRKGKAPRRIQVLAERIKKAYLKKCASVFDRVSESFRAGKTFTQDDARRELQKAAATTYSRSKMIVATETTSYYNKATLEHYKQTKQVTHYLFVAVMDKNRTTQWCRDRDGLVYEADSAILEREKPACFLGGTPILTSDGWKAIATVKEGDYVYTAKKNFRRVTKVHCKSSGQVRIFQIGYALATSNHPYLSRTGCYVWADEFEPQKEGVCAISFRLCCLQANNLDSVEHISISKHLQSEVPFTRDNEERLCASVLENWKASNEKRLHGRILPGSSVCEQTRYSNGTQDYNGEISRSDTETRRSNTPYRPEQIEQLYRESAIDVEFRTHGFASEIGWFDASKESCQVYNLEVEIDHSYNAGGFFVHNCHWNCRSRMLPLTPLNPTHRKFIEDKTRRREANRCTPLPPGWGE